MLNSILLVEDNLLYREALALNFNQHGYYTYTASNGDDALEMLGQLSIDVLVTDILLPQKDGIELIGQVKQKYPNIEIVSMTGGGRVSVESIVSMLEVIAPKYILKKPFKVSELLAILDSILE